jgi:hypothetical protein
MKSRSLENGAPEAVRILKEHFNVSWPSLASSKRFWVSSLGCRFESSADGKRDTKLRARSGNVPNWRLFVHCQAPGCPTELLVGGFFTIPESGFEVGLKSEVHAWSFTKEFKSHSSRATWISAPVNSCCSHSHNPDSGVTAPYGSLRGQKRISVRDKIAAGTTGRVFHNNALTEQDSKDKLHGNYSAIGKSKAVVNKLAFEIRQDGRPGGRDEFKGLDDLRKKMILDDITALVLRSEIGRNRVFGSIQSISMYPHVTALFTEGMLILYRALARLPAGLNGDYTGGIVRLSLQMARPSSSKGSSSPWEHPTLSQVGIPTEIHLD